MPFPRRLEKVIARESLAETIPNFADFQASSPSVPASAMTIATPPAPGGSGQAKFRAPPVVDQATHALWPQSRNLQTGSSALRLGPSFTIHVAVPNARPPPRREAYPHPHLQRQLRPHRSWARRGRPPRRLACEDALRPHAPAPRKCLGCASADRELGSRGEAYSPVVPADDSAAVPSANSMPGLSRGHVTFAQPWYIASGTVYTRSARQLLSKHLPAYVCLQRAFS
ncbi:hypothetical protein EDB89DRAFT_2076321 [Lactarius sanguifluus]|nr:hypothetical protein EDB89DRAFT_2076321 [Lactarius sanguifluus]